MPAKPGPLRPHETRSNYARQAPREAPPGDPALGDSFLLITEGEVTEKLYFEKLREALQIRAATVRVVHPSCTDAVGLVSAAIEARVRQNQGRNGLPYDHVWVLFDTDAAAAQGKLAAALALAQQHGLHAGHSTPCAEVWLLLHFRDRPGPFLNSGDVGKAIGAARGETYNKSTGSFSRLWPELRKRIPDAVGRAGDIHAHHLKVRSPFPANPSTELHHLVRALNAAVQPPLRLL